MLRQPAVEQRRIPASDAHRRLAQVAHGEVWQTAERGLGEDACPAACMARDSRKYSSPRWGGHRGIKTLGRLKVCSPQYAMVRGRQGRWKRPTIVQATERRWAFPKQLESSWEDANPRPQSRPLGFGPQIPARIHRPAIPASGSPPPVDENDTRKREPTAVAAAWVRTAVRPLSGQPATVIFTAAGTHPPNRPSGVGALCRAARDGEPRRHREPKRRSCPSREGSAFARRLRSTEIYR